MYGSRSPLIPIFTSALISTISYSDALAQTASQDSEKMQNQRSLSPATVEVPYNDGIKIQTPYGQLSIISVRLGQRLLVEQIGYVAPSGFVLLDVTIEKPEISEDEWKKLLAGMRIENDTGSDITGTYELRFFAMGNVEKSTVTGIQINLESPQRISSTGKSLGETGKWKAHIIASVRASAKSVLLRVPSATMRVRIGTDK